jgi:hypothetical protein
MLCYIWLNKLLYHRWVSKFLRTDYLYGFVFLRCSKVHKGCFKKVTWTIHHPLSGLSLAQKRSRLKTHTEQWETWISYSATSSVHRPHTGLWVTIGNRVWLLWQQEQGCHSTALLTDSGSLISTKSTTVTRKRTSVPAILYTSCILSALLLEICALLRSCAEQRANSLSTFRHDLSRNVGRSHRHRGGSLKSHWASLLQNKTHI